MIITVKVYTHIIELQQLNVNKQVSVLLHFIPCQKCFITCNGYNNNSNKTS